VKKIIKSVIWIAAIFAIFTIVANISYYLRPKSKAAKQLITVPKTKAKEIPSVSSIKKEVTGVRICLRNGTNIRTGPGTNYPIDKSSRLVEGESLYVLEEKDGWIHFRVTIKDVGWSGWAKKDLTVSKQEWDLAKYEKDIKILEENELLIRINPQMNEAFVESAIWNSLDFQTKQNIGRSMAFYCGIKKGTNLNWIDIRDSYSGRKLAKYSEAWGFKVY